MQEIIEQIKLYQRLEINNTSNKKIQIKVINNIVKKAFEKDIIISIEKYHKDKYKVYLENSDDWINTILIKTSDIYMSTSFSVIIKKIKEYKKNKNQQKIFSSICSKSKIIEKFNEILNNYEELMGLLIKYA